MFKRIKLSRICMAFVSILFAVCMLCQNVGSFKTMAGASKVYVVSAASLQGSAINEGDFLVDGGVYAKESKAIFDAKASKTARMLAKAKINNYKDYGVSKLMETSTTINVSSIANGGKIAILFGLNASRDGSGAADSAEVVLTYANNTLYIGVNEYVTANTAKAVAPTHSYTMFSLNSDIVFNMNVDVYGKMYLTAECPEAKSGVIDILKGAKLSIDPTGYMAYASYSTDSAKNVFKLSDLSVIAYAYDVVETVDHYLENFNKNSYNANMFYSQSTGSAFAPSKIYVEDGKLIFRNVAQGYFTTREKYSNFELKFDITDLYREGEKDAEGNITKLISHWFMIGFGVDNYNDPASERIQATFLHFEGMPGNSAQNPSNHFTGEVGQNKNRYVLWNNGSAANVTSMLSREGSWSLWDKDYVGDETVNIRFRMVDGLVTLEYKLASQSEYTLQYTYDLGTTQTGCVRLYTYGNSDIDAMGTEYTCVLNMTIDNFEITNLDNEAVKIVKAAPVYKSNVQPTTKDFVYTTNPDAKDLLNNKLAK